MVTVISRHRSLGFALLVIGLLAHAGSAIAQDEDDTKALRDQKAIQAMLIGFADKYLSTLTQISHEIAASEPANPELRATIHAYKLNSARSALEIATGPNPGIALIDMLVFARLQRLSMQDPRWPEFTDTQRQRIVASLKNLEYDIWDSAGRYLSVDEESELKELIERWRRKNPDIRYVFYIRFDDFAVNRLDSTLADKVRKGGFLVDVSDVSRSADEAILLAERAMQMTNRLPLLLSWEIETLFYRLATSIEARQALDQSAKVTSSLQSFAATVEDLPKQIAVERKTTIDQIANVLGKERGAAIHDVGELFATQRLATIENLHNVLATERAAFFSELDARGAALAQSAEFVKTSLSDADRLTVHLGETSVMIKEAIDSADRMMGRFDKEAPATAEPSEPFDLASYVEAIRELTVTIQEANTLMLSTERIIGNESPIANVFNRVLWVGTLLIVILCVAAFFTMLAYRAAVRRIFVDAGA